MPEYLAPGVFVEEVSFRSKPIEGVSTSTAGFVGMTRRGAVDDTSRMLTSFADFERIFGGTSDLAVEPGTNFLAHSVRAFFNEGGRRLYVARVIGADTAVASTANLVPGKSGRFRATFGGDAGNGRVILSVAVAPVKRDAVAKVPLGSLVRVNYRKPVFALKVGRTWRDAEDLGRTRRLSVVTTAMELLTLSVTLVDKDGATQVFQNLGFDARHPFWAGNFLSVAEAHRNHREVPLFCLELSEDVTALDLLKLATPDAGQANKQIEVGTGPNATPGTDAMPSLNDWQAALARLESIDDIAVVAAPGHTELPEAKAVTTELVKHVSASGAYRVAVLDVPRGHTVEEALAYKTQLESRHAALYYPWVIVAGNGGEMTLPPSGFLCGIYARVDTERGVLKAPANEVVRGALRFERGVSKAEQDVLNPAGVNCLRFFEGRGNRVWGARTTSSDPEWKYVNVRRLFIYLEHSINKGTQWAVFEPNGEALWADVRRNVEGFLRKQWLDGALLGEKPEKAFFVKCDRSTMTQDDIDNGRLVCLVGVAPIKPAEFVLFRIGQWTADATR